jgi:PmbA protein
VHNLFISDSGQHQEALMKQMDRGLLITELMGSAVNPVTGDYSRGAAGFWVEDGEIAYPVEEFTLAGSLPEMFHNLQASGTDVDGRARIHCGSLLLAPMKVAGMGQ